MTPLVGGPSGRTTAKRSRLGFLLDDEYTQKILRLSRGVSETPYRIMIDAIDTMYNYYYGEDDAG